MVEIKDADSPEDIRDQENAVRKPSWLEENQNRLDDPEFADKKHPTIGEQAGTSLARKNRLQESLAARENDYYQRTMDDEGNPKPKPRGLRLGKGIFIFFNRHKKKTITGMVIGGTGVGLTVAGFFAVQPFKVVSIVNSLEGFYGGPTTSIISRASNKLVGRYLQRYVIPGLMGAKPRCVTTVSPKCVSGVTGKGPIARAMKAMWQSHWESDLANQENGVIFKRQGRDIKVLLKNPGGNPTEAASFAWDSDFTKAIVSGKADLFDPALSPVGIGEGSAFDRGSLQEGLKLIDQAYSKGWMNRVKRFFVKRIFKQKYAGLSCFFNCKIVNPIKAPIQKLQGAFKYWLADQLENVYGQTYMGTALSCLLRAGDCDNVQKVQPSTAQAGEVSPAASATGAVTTTEAEAVTEASGEIIAHGGIELLDEPAGNAAGKLLGKAAAESERGFLTTILSAILSKILTNVFGVSSEAAIDIALNVVPVAGTVTFIVLIVAGFISFADSGNPGLQHATFIGNSSMSVRLFGVFQTATSEAMHGGIDMAGLNGFNDALTTNSTGSPKDQVDATTTPLYGRLFGGTLVNTNYRCNDGSPVPDGQLVCPEEKLAQGNQILDAAHNIVTFVPTVAALAHIINSVNELIGTIGSKGFELACNIEDALPPAPGGPSKPCSSAIAQVTPLFSKFVAWIMDKLVVSPFASNMSGGRVFDMMAAGADVLYNKTCQLQLGCAKVTDQQATALRNEALDMQKEEFAQRPIFARMFSTDTPYSLVSQLALALPSSPSQAATQLAGVFSNPVNSVGSMVSRLLSGSKVFADSTFPDPFGVIQYGYTDDQIPSDPETYWNQNCEGKDFATEWDNSQTLDEATGEPVATTTQPCMLLQVTAGAVAGSYDTSVLPADALNPDPK